MPAEITTGDRKGAIMKKTNIILLASMLIAFMFNTGCATYMIEETIKADGSKTVRYIPVPTVQKIYHSYPSNDGGGYYGGWGGGYYYPRQEKFKSTTEYKPIPGGGYKETHKEKRTYR